MHKALSPVLQLHKGAKGRHALYNTAKPFTRFRHILYFQLLSFPLFLRGFLHHESCFPFFNPAKFFPCNTFDIFVRTCRLQHMGQLVLFQLVVGLLRLQFRLPVLQFIQLNFLPPKGNAHENQSSAQNHRIKAAGHTIFSSLWHFPAHKLSPFPYKAAISILYRLPFFYFFFNPGFVFFPALFPFIFYPFFCLKLLILQLLQLILLL